VKHKIDLDEMKRNLKEGFRDFGKTMEGTIRSVVEGFKSMDFGEVVSGAFGSSKGSAEKEIILSAEDLTGINIKSQSGDVIVTGSETGDVLIHAVVTTRGSDPENAKLHSKTILVSRINMNCSFTSVLCAKLKFMMQKLIKRLRKGKQND